MTNKPRLPQKTALTLALQLSWLVALVLPTEGFADSGLLFGTQSLKSHATNTQEDADNSKKTTAVQATITRKRSTAPVEQPPTSAHKHTNTRLRTSTTQASTPTIQRTAPSTRVLSLNNQNTDTTPLTKQQTQQQEPSTQPAAQDTLPSPKSAQNAPAQTNNSPLFWTQPNTKRATTPKTNTPNKQTPSDNTAQATIVRQNLSLSTNTPSTARTTTRFDPIGKSLTQLGQFYQKSTQSAYCQGVWQYPTGHQSTPTFTDGMSARANYGYYNARDLAELSGNVIINQADREIRADKITLNPLTGQSLATGMVAFGSTTTEHGKTTKMITIDKLPQSDLMGIADALNYNTQTGHAYASDIAFASRSLHAHGYAKTLERKDDTGYHMQGAIFSTCPPDNRLWHIKADDISIDSTTGRGISKNTTLNIKGVPVFYLPYFNFPIDKRRTSGFLTPSLGINSKDGLQLSTPYYLNLAPNYDATLTPTLYTNRNPRLAGEFRYLTRHYGEGKIEGAYLPNDRQYQKRTRSHLFFDHLWRPFDEIDFSVIGTYRHVSDGRYLSDFDGFGLANTPLNLPRRVVATYKNDHLDASLRAETYQKLAGTDQAGNPILDKDRPYSRLPQLSINYILPTPMKGLSLTGASHNAYFKKSIKDGSATEKSGVRLYNQLSASYPMLKPWGYATPKLSLTHLYVSYDEDSLAGHGLSKKDGDFSVFAPSLSLDTGLYFKKQEAPFVRFGNTLGGYQLISPRLKYLYTPHKDQSNLPNFDTTQASMSYDQLLADSWFIGHDRIGDVHAITPAINYRYIDAKGITRLDGSIAEQIYLTPPKVGLNTATTAQAKRSGLAWQLTATPHRDVWFDLSGSLKDNHTLNTLTGAVRYQPYANMLFSAGIVERRENQAFGQLPLSAYTASTLFPINNKWQLMASTQYDKTYQKFMDTVVGINYEDCCIGVSVYGRQYYDSLQPNDTHRAVMAELRLSGLTGNGRLANLLKERILGYDGAPLTTPYRADSQ